MNNKILVWLYLVVLSIGTIANLYMPKVKATSQEEIIIPGEAIRLRILANSDRKVDQDLKRKVRDEVNEKIAEWVGDLTSLDQARETIKAGLPEIEQIAREVLSENGSDQAAKAEFGKVKFPTKLYGQFLYPAGEYEAILITLGEGKGANWWCVLYPPLCFLDFSNGTAVASPGFEESREAVSADSEVPKDEKLGPETDKGEMLQEENVHSEEREEGLQPISTGKEEKKKPVFTPEDEQPIKVKFFVVEMWEKIIN
ncbi:stage II sporulation protein R [Bacillus sp. FJAT-27225]|uniref:stage II sporulation protein R n=1 Tax=Bacillus sp. FJAT-27225 TaxID=1743144 RepID=UPI00080C2AB4|nr:stage II sporulation protein R [Bacillus sp. FJAT-27225]OCA82383.1 stage II sporulation protein R [Bacillus sp. FJAT-27225]